MLTHEERKMLRAWGLETPPWNIKKALAVINRWRERDREARITQNEFWKELNMGGIHDKTLKGYSIPKDTTGVTTKSAEVENVSTTVIVQTDIRDERPFVTELTKSAIKYLLSEATWRQVREIMQLSWDSLQLIQTEILVLGFMDKKTGPRGHWSEILDRAKILDMLPECTPGSWEFEQVTYLQERDAIAAQNRRLEKMGYVFAAGHFMPKKNAEKLLKKLQAAEAKEAERRRRQREQEEFRKNILDNIMIRLVDIFQTPTSWARVQRRFSWGYIESEKYKTMALELGLIRKMNSNIFDDRYVIVG